MFDKWHKKEKPVFTGYWFGFGAAAAGGAGADDASGAATASGGNVEYTLGTNKIHVFTSPGTLSVASGDQIVAEYVLVGGGGGSAGDAGGGGGAGGVVSSIPGIMPVTRTPLTMNAGETVTVTIGPGGVKSGAGQPDSPAYPGPGPANRGGNGYDTFFAGPAGNSVRALGGGAGGAESNTGPSNLPVPQSSGGKGGSGGGSRGGRPESANTPGLDNQGNVGSRAVAPALTPGIAGGGGGGAGGGAGSSLDGGVGIQLPPSFRDDTQPTDVKGDPGNYGGGTAPTPGGWWFAGGGGAYTDSNYPVSAPYGGPIGEGGAGGGGKGANPPEPVQPQNGQTNTGGGGGGQGAGGPGIAFFIYPIA